MVENTPPKIRKFKSDDIHRLLEIEKEAFPKTAYSKETFLYYAKIFPDSFVVLEKGKDIAGYMIFDGEGHIHSTAIKPEYRRKGFGATLFRHALKWAEKRLWLEVRSKNSAAIAFYKRMGMRVTGKIVKYYGNDDALIMTLSKKEKGGEI
jgi:ribosomal-protein-alanine N-acetyltransferase